MTTEDGRMNPVVKAGVLRRLADPANKQGQGALRRDLNEPGDGQGGVCCLELVCQEAIEAGIIPPAVFDPDQTRDDGYSGTWEYGPAGDRSHAYLPSKVANWAGLTGNDPVFDLSSFRDRNVRDYWLTWSGLNDDEGFTFAQIYDMVNYFC